MVSLIHYIIVETAVACSQTEYMLTQLEYSLYCLSTFVLVVELEIIEQ